MAVQEMETKAGGLVLNSLEIKNFRAFQHLTIEKLGRVNLITGKNNGGKSSLLEAIWLYLRGGSSPLIRGLLNARNELRATRDTRASSSAFATSELGEDESLYQGIRFLFHGRPDIHKNADPILIGPTDDPNRLLKVSLRWLIDLDADDEFAPPRLVEVGQGDSRINEASLYLTVT